MSDDAPEESMAYRDLKTRVGATENELKRVHQQLIRAYAAAAHNEERVGVWRDRYARMAAVAAASLEGGVSKRRKVQREYNVIIKEVQDETTPGSNPQSS